MHFEQMLKVGAAAIVRRGVDGWELLSARRTEPPVVAGKWEFPGGKIEDGETQQQCVLREIREELGVDLVLHERVDGPLEGFWPLTERIAFSLWLATIVDGQQPEILEDHDAIEWLPAHDLFRVEWVPADIPLVQRLSGLLADDAAMGNVTQKRG